MEVTCHALDLGRTPNALLAEVRELAAAIWGTTATYRPGDQVTLRPVYTRDLRILAEMLCS